MQIAQRFADRFIGLILIAEMGDARFIAEEDCHRIVFSDTSLSTARGCPLVLANVWTISRTGTLVSICGAKTLMGHSCNNTLTFELIGGIKSLRFGAHGEQIVVISIP